MMNGGFVPGGSLRSADCEIDVICATAASVFVPGWKKILTTEIPRSVCDSICSMSLTVVVRPRSKPETMRLAISSADIPLYCQTAVTTGMLMFGKMSVGVRVIARGPTNRIATASTTNVYGLLSAIRTIHIAENLRIILSDYFMTWRPAGLVCGMCVAMLSFAACAPDRGAQAAEGQKARSVKIEQAQIRE